MPTDLRTELSIQVGRVRRRLFVRDFLDRAVIGLVAALGICTFGLLIEPYIYRGAPDSIRLSVLGGIVGLSIAGSLLLAYLRRPSSTASALSLDRAFQLRERVTTCLALTKDDVNSEVGRAVVSDTLQRVKGIKVSEQFPIQIGTRGWWVPAATVALVLVALFYSPPSPVAQANTEAKTITAADKAALDKSLEAMARPKREPTVEAEKGKSEDLKRLEAKLEEVARQPRDTTKQLRERVKDMTPIEDDIKKLERERSEKSKMLQQQLQMKEQILPKDATQQEGPAKEFMKALAEGDMEGAREQMDKLAKKIAKNELSEQEKQQLGKQLNQVQKKLNDLAQQKDKEEMLKKLGEDGKLDSDALEREMSQLRQENEKLKDLQKLANKLNQCQQCMKAGDAQGAEKAMGQAADQIGDMARDEKELNDLRDALQNLKDARDAMTKALDETDSSSPGGNRGNDGDGNGGNGDSMNQRPNNGDFGQGAGIGRGQRPDGDQSRIRPYDAKQNGKFNPKGQKVFDGFVPGQAFKKKSGVDLATDIKQAAQEAPEAIETQRIPKAARDMAKGYFKNLGGQAEAEKKEKNDEKK